MYLLDTNACIAWMRGRNRTFVQRANSKPGELVVCSIVAGELWYGALHSDDPARHLQLVDKFLEHIPCLPFEMGDARIYASIRDNLSTAGMMIGPNDMQIAAIALRHGHQVVTHNVAEFTRVAGLRVEDWEI
jgi:tRNA(fMet)-specific endonuclease VapC